ncbi:MAG: nucleotide exchange factor GrpE [Eubacteriales bacterium]
MENEKKNKMTDEKVSEMMEEVEKTPDGGEEKKTAEKSEAKSEKKEKSAKKLECELKEAKKQLEALEGELKDSKDKYLTMLAEYDNFRRRTAKEKESTYSDAYADVLTQILPVIDNLERAAAYKDGESVIKGLELTLKSFSDVLAKLNIKEIESVGKTFDPNLHNAVLHVEDDSLGEGEIVEVLQKGYMCGDKVLRYAMVKVAN